MPHNGGLSQTVFHFLGVGGEFPFLNMMKCAQRWGCDDNSANIKPVNHDSNGYVHTIENGGVKTVFFAPSQSQRAGNYVLKWDGGGTLGVNNSHTLVSGSLTALAGTINNRYVFSTSATQFGISVNGVSSPGGGAGNYPTNIRVCHVDDEALLDSGEVFSTLLKSKLARIGVIRFLDWQLINTSPLRLFADETPVAHFSYAAPYWPSSRYAGFTTNVGDAYSITFGSGGPVDGEQILITFNATSSGYTPTFNKNGTGDVNIKFSDGRTIAFDVWKPSIGRTGVLTYNQALNCWLKFGGDTEEYDAGFYTVPVSICLRLCKEVGAHPWIHIPYLSVDPLSTYTANMATSVKAYTDANATWMIPRFEPINEVWNSAGGFPVTRLGWALENVRVGSATDDIHNWYGRVVSKVGKAVSAVYSDDRTKYQIICGVQAYGSIITSANRLESARYVTETGQASDAAKNWATTVSCATYWHSSFAATATETSMATEYASASAARKIELVNEYVSSEAGTNPFSMAGTFVQTTIWINWAISYNLKFAPYEGGFDYGWSEGSGTTQIFTRAAYYAPELYDQTIYQYERIIELGGEFPSLYTFAGNSSWGAGGVGITIFGPASTQWDAIVAYNTPEPEPEVPAPSSGGGGAAHPTKIKHEKERRQLLKKHEQQLEQTIRLAYQRLTGKVTEPPQLKQDLSPPKLAMLAEKMAEQLIEKSKDSAKQRTRNKEIIADLKRQAAAIMQEEEEAIVMLLH